MRAFAILAVLVLTLASPLSVAQDGTQTISRSSVQLYIPAVGQNADGTLFGVASFLTVTIQRPGTGQVYLSTQPLTEVDMQGSARLAVDTASTITGLPASNADFFFTVRTPSVTIGGPSAGGAMAVAVTALLEGWSVRKDVVMTGMINPDGSIGPIGGQDKKLDAAASVKANQFLVPLGESTVVVQGQAANGQATQQTIDLKQVGRDKYGIAVSEIADLYDAVTPFTGYKLVRPQATKDPLRDAAYGNITRELALNLTSQASTRLDALSTRYDKIRADIGNDQSTIDAQLATTRQRLTDARKAQNDSKQYQASSLAFQGLVALDYADALVTYHEHPTDVPSYTTDYLTKTSALLDSVQADIKATYPMPASRLDSQAAAEQRLLEARSSTTDAQNAATNRNYGSALQAASFARERAESARWWFKIGQDVARLAPTPSITVDNVRGLIAKYQDATDLELAYGNLVAQGNDQFTAAQAAQQQATTALNQSMWAAAVIELVTAIAQTNTAFVSLAGPDPVRQRLDQLSQAAAYEIDLATSQGSPPIYAIALLELGASRADQDPVAAYASYSTARLSARSSLVAASVSAPSPMVERAPAVSALISNPRDLTGLLGGLLVLAIVAIILLIVWGLHNRSQSASYAPPLPPPGPAPDAWPPAPAPLPDVWTPIPAPAPALAPVDLAAPEPAPAPEAVAQVAAVPETPNPPAAALAAEVAAPKPRTPRRAPARKPRTASTTRTRKPKDE